MKIICSAEEKERLLKNCKTATCFNCVLGMTCCGKPRDIANMDIFVVKEKSINPFTGCSYEET